MGHLIVLMLIDIGAWDLGAHDKMAIENHAMTAMADAVPIGPQRIRRGEAAVHRSFLSNCGGFKDTFPIIYICFASCISVELGFVHHLLRGSATRSGDKTKIHSVAA